MSRLNWNDRQGPGDFDNTAPVTPDYSFDYRRGTRHGEPSWPERHGKERFGPALLGKAWRAGLVVVAEVEGQPHPVAVTESRWSAGVLEVKVSGSWCIPDRLWTRDTVKGLDSTGLLIEERQPMTKTAFNRDGILNDDDRLKSARKCLALLTAETGSMGEREAAFVEEMSEKLERWGYEKYCC